MTEAHRVLIADKLSGRCAERLRCERRLRVDERPGLDAADLPRVIGEYAALIVRSRTKVTAGVIEAGRNLKAIGRAGSGVDNIDVGAATRAGIVVMNVPGGNTISAAEHTLSLILALARWIPEADASVKAGRWERSKFVGTELHAKTLGVVGVGRVGREVAARAAAFGMEVLGFDPLLPAGAKQRSPVQFVSLGELLRRSDVITIHAPLTPQTRHLIGGRELAACKPGVRVVNCARGGIVDERAVDAALRDGRVGGAAFDVYEQEPPGDLPFRDLPNVICTPHLAASTVEAQERVAAEIAEQIRDYLLDGLARNAVNPPLPDGRTPRSR